MKASISCAFLSFLLQFSSCDRVKPKETHASNSAVHTSNATSANVFFERLFETSDGLSGLNLEKAYSYSMQISNATAYEGSQSLRIELRESDAEVAGGTRSELNLGHAQNKEQWYSFAVYFPAQYNTPDRAAEQIMQWHAVPDAGEEWRTPAKSLQIQNGRFIMKIGYNSQPISSASVPFEGEKQYDLGPVTTDAWQQFAFHVIHSYGSDGLVEVWKNGTKILEHRGGNSYNDTRLPYWKVGLYKWPWNGTGKTDVSTRVLYFDNIRQGTSAATLEEMTGKKITQPAPVSG
ncbi:polysaccharide lyase [Pontibacter burrus]|uniref:Polysaccharide lyase n=1 Tax=Pontibacter burrus TaxID=2704466 RepID=A0A6B3LRT2_9BACT|nr:polysaccharide lyase [Pontibacter burrus]NEM97755.1 hypothetical protein [Pontibacter burrus]